MIYALLLSTPVHHRLLRALNETIHKVEICTRVMGPSFLCNMSAFPSTPLFLITSEACVDFIFPWPKTNAPDAPNANIAPELLAPLGAMS